MCKNKHLSLDDRLIIERELGLDKSFKYIGNLINKDCTIKNSDSYGRIFNNCIYRHDCRITSLCNNCHQSRNRLYRYCLSCKNICSNYKEEICSKLSNPLIFVTLVKVYPIVHYPNIFMKLVILLMNINKFFLKLDRAF